MGRGTLSVGADVESGTGMGLTAGFNLTVKTSSMGVSAFCFGASAAAFRFPARVGRRTTRSKSELFELMESDVEVDAVVGRVR